MKVKEIGRTANIAWSPQQQHPVYMVAGTAAQQLDATFSTSAALEVYSLNLGDPSLEMPVVASIPSDCRFNKVAWGCYGVSDDLSNGVIVGGGDGCLLAYNANKCIDGNKDCLMFKKDKHTGAVKALDFNPFQNNLLVSGGAESEIFIWDLNNPDSPMTPGAKSQPPEEVACVSWNRQVQHILASTFTARCVVWDLRKNEPIIKVSDSMSRIKPKLVCWNPEVATQMCLSSEDDHAPIIQLWDLRYATSPIKVLENHQRGILSMAWCPQDPDLLLSCAKDNRILCWNPNSAAPNGEVVYEIPTSHQWSFDVQWCPRNPNIISSSSFDGSVTCFSLMGGGHPIHQIDKVSESFHSNDPFTQAMHQQQQQQQQSNVMPLQKPPKWLQKPVGANFGFGGQLVSFENTKPQNPQQPMNRQVTVSQVVTETDLVTGSLQLEQALTNGQHVEFCAMKAANSNDSMQESIWNFLTVNFEKEPRERYIQLLGYDKTELAKKVSQHTKTEGLDESIGAGVDADELAQKMNQLGTGEPGLQAFSSSGQASPSVGSKTPGSQDDLNFSSNNTSAFDDIGLNSSVSKKKEESPLSLTATSDADGLLCQALLTGNFAAAVDMCLSENRMAEAILLSIAGGPELLSRTQQRYFQKNSSNLSRFVSAIVTHDWRHIVTSCELENWKEALAVILTYSPSDDFSTLCDTLATRLENEGSGEFAPYAALCYICSGNVEKMVENWCNTSQNSNSPMALQDLVEKVMVLRKAVETSRGQAPEITTGVLADKLSGYASILAAQGRLDTALRYLGDSQEYSLTLLKDRLNNALGITQGVQSPWQKVNVTAKPSTVQQPRQSSYQPTANTSYTAGQNASYTNQYPVSNGPSIPNYNVNNPLSGTSMPSYNTGMPSNVPSYNTGNQGVTSSVPTYSGPIASTSVAATMNKGPLSNKYPTAPSNTYNGSVSGYGVSTYNPTDYNQPSSTPNTYYNNSGPYMTPGQQVDPSMQPTSNPGYQAPPSSTGSSYNNQVHSFQDYKPDKAWNDPPMVIKKDKPKVSQPAPDTAPITNPIYGSQGQTNQPAPPSGQQPYGNFYNPQEYKPEPPAVPEPVKPVQKAPLPAEHKVLQDIFDNLVHNCQARASNAQMKRKLEDVTKKLEILYDRLREGSLSPAVTTGLHQIIQSVQQYDYNAGLSIYTQMVSQGNFSEISSFMPGLKMLIQSATQLQVYVQ